MTTPSPVPHGPFPHPKGLLYFSAFQRKRERVIADERIQCGEDKDTQWTEREYLLRPDGPSPRLVPENPNTFPKIRDIQADMVKLAEDVLLRFPDEDQVEVAIHNKEREPVKHDVSNKGYLVTLRLVEREMVGYIAMDELEMDRVFIDLLQSFWENEGGERGIVAWYKVL